MTNNQLRYVILAGLFAVPFVPLIVAPSLFFPFITGKAFIFRVIVEIIFACYLILAIRDPEYRPKFSWIMGAVLGFLIIIGLADLFAENPFKAIWSNYERMEGYIALLHFAAYFVALSSVLKTQNIWNKLLATSLGASAIMAVYSFFQLAGKITINQGGVRVDGTLGNASYLGIYMVFHIFFAGLLFSRFKKNWQRVLIGTIALADLIILYFTATRGATLGLIGGALMAFIFLVWQSERGARIRKVAIGGLLALMILIGFFVVIKDTEFVRQSKVLSRFASLSLSELPTQGRYYIWPMAVKGFVERPILGWGQEGFNFVFNKYYDPRMHDQEQWFDRAHSTPLDWLIAGGLLGSLSYLSIFGALLFYVFKSSDEYLSKDDKAIVLGLIAAYFFNNIFVFDQISSYLFFFLILAYAHSHSPEINPAFWEKLAVGISKGAAKLKGPVFESGVVLGLVLMLYFANYLPWRQNKNLLYAMALNNAGQVGTLEDYTQPLQSYRMGFSEALEHVSQIANASISNPNFPPELRDNLFDHLDRSFQKYIAKVPSDARYRLFYGSMLSRFGWYGRAVEQFEKAVELSPNKQTLMFELVNSLILDNRKDEALEVARRAHEAEPSYNEARLVYSIAALSAGKSALAQEILSQTSTASLLFDDRYLAVLLDLGQYAKLIEVAKKRVVLNPNNKKHRITLAAAYLEAGRRIEAIAVLEELIKIDSSFGEQGEYFINEIKAGRNP